MISWAYKLVKNTCNFTTWVYHEKAGKLVNLVLVLWSFFQMRQVANESVNEGSWTNLFLRLLEGCVAAPRSQRQLKWLRENKRQISIEKLSFWKKLPLLKRGTSASAAVPLKWGHSSFQSNWKHEMRNWLFSKHENKLWVGFRAPWGGFKFQSRFHKILGIVKTVKHRWY